MVDSRLNDPERGWQSPFSLAVSTGVLLIVAIVGACAWLWDHGPDRTPLPPRAVALNFIPVALNSSDVAPLRLAGAWEMQAGDPRFGGLSALAFDRGQLLALSDSGVLVRFTPPRGAGNTPALISELPDGPGSPMLKENRDSEALAADPGGRGWWVAFEQRNQVWRYDRDFTRGAPAMAFGRKRWPRNVGIEAMLVAPDKVTVIPEQAGEVVEVTAGRATSAALQGATSHISDAVRMPDGNILVLLRGVGISGFENALGILAKDAAGWKVSSSIPLNVGTFANLEGMAVQRLPNGRTRLWLVTDDNFQPPQTTMLIALDLPVEGWPTGGRP